MAGPGVRRPPLAVEEAALALARQQRVAVVQREQELRAVLQRLHRVEHLEGQAGPPARQRELAQQAGLDEVVGQPGHDLGRDRDRQRCRRVDRRAEGDQRVDVGAAAVGGGLVGEHAALRVAAQHHRAAGRLDDAVDGVADGEHVVGERALEPAGLAVGVPEVDDPGVDALLVQRADGGLVRGETSHTSVVTISGGTSRIAGASSGTSSAK